MKKLFLIMRLTVIITLVLSIQASASVYSQMTKMNMALKNTSLEEVIDVIRDQSEFKFLYNHEEIEHVQNVNVEFENATVEEILDQVLESYDLAYRVVNDVVVIVPAPGKTNQKPEESEVPAEQKKITYKGTVVDEDGQPVPFAAVVIKGTTIGAATDENGAFEFEVPEGDYEAMVASSVGLISHQILIDNNTNFEFVLRTDVAGLDEVLVTGYATISRERATGSFSKVSGDQVDKPASSLAERLVGTLSGVQASVNADGSIDFEIRGQSSLLGEAAPLIVIDGFPISQEDDNSEYDGMFPDEDGTSFRIDPFSTINPNDIESVTVLKDAASASIWGARSANGVIVITTKKAKKGKANVTVSSFVKFSNKLDLGYLNPKASSAETVEYEKLAFERNNFGFPHILPTPSPFHVTKAQSQAAIALNEHKLGNISESELNATLSRLSAQNNMGQIEDYLLQAPVTHQHNISISGGTDLMQNSLSLMYEGSEEFFKGNDMDKFLINYKTNAQITNWLTLNFSGMLQMNERSFNGVGVADIAALAPYDMLKNEDGSLTNLNNLYYYTPNLYRSYATELFPYPDWSYNPITEIENRDRTTRDINARVQTGLTFKIMDGLTFDSKFQYETFNIKNRQYYNENTFAVRNLVNQFSAYNPITPNVAPVSNFPKGGILSTFDPSASFTGARANNIEVRTIIYRNQLNFNRSFKEKHSINAIVGAETIDRVSQATTNPTSYGYNDDMLTVGNSPSKVGLINFMGRPPYISSSDPKFRTTNSYVYTTDRFFSLYGNVAYTFNDKYTLSGSARTDASNMITDDPKYRYAPFWSTGIGWQMAKEDFMSGIKWVDRLSLRATYGFNGNVDRSTSFTPLIALNTIANIYTDEVAASISSYGNPTLRWEKTGSFNIGVDYSLFNSKLYGSIEYYTKQSKDLIIQESTADLYGTNSVKYNNGRMSNKGIEFSVGTSLPIKGKDIRWNGNLNLSYNKNEITALNKTKYIHIMDMWDGATSSYVKGENANTLWSYQYAGLYNFGSESNPRMGASIHGVDGAQYPITGYILNEDARDFMIADGTFVAPCLLGFTNSFKIYDFNLSFILTGKFGHKFRRLAYDYAPVWTGNTNVNETYSEVVNADPNEIIPFPENEGRYYMYGRFSNQMDYLTENAGHIRIQEVNLTYNLPKQILKKVGINALSVYGQANNLGTILFNDYGEDPEYPKGTIKPVATYTFGLKLNL